MSTRNKGKKCRVDICPKPASTRGYCQSHYRRDQKYGDPLAGGPFRNTLPDGPIPDDKQWCSRCRQVLDMDRFTNPNAPWCQRCYKSSALERMYNITLDWYEETFAKQGGGCDTCHVAIDPQARVAYFSVDHDHDHCPGPKSCGECVRGLLCNNCNRVLGMVDDNVEILMAMVDYINRHATRSEMEYGRS